MTPENRTSQAVELLELDWQEKFPMPVQWPHIAEKYKRMEGALKKIATAPMPELDDGQGHMNRAIASDSLEFDPLSMNEPKGIIGIARELQKKCDGDRSYLSEEIANARIDTNLLDALLIAVEALEKIEDGSGCSLHQCGLMTGEALRRIRSLT